MDADDEKLKQLKIAYADMILNTTKEAAARIMVSERRAFRLELELKHSKENAIQMLMRLKQTMDSKMREAETASRAQQKKIEELEAQLQEAEDIVKDLREELSAVQAELERVSAKEEVKPMLQVYEALEKNVVSDPDGIAFSDINSDKDRDDNNQGHNSLFPFWKSCINDQDLPSIILRSKGTKMYRSGCTQRIRACDMITKADEGEKLHKSLSLGDERKKSRKRASPNTKKRTSSPNKLVDQVKEMDRVADNSCLTTSKSVKRSVATDLVRLSDVHRRIREELQLQKIELPPSSEAKVDPLESKALENAGVPISIQPTSSSRVIKYTFQRKRKRGTLSTDGSDLHNLKKKKEDNETATLETEKTISMEEESTQEETAKVNSIQESTEKVISVDESTQEETAKVNSIEESTQEETEKLIVSTQEETEKLIESTQEGTDKVIESTQEGTDKVIESTQEGTERVFTMEESTQEETVKLIESTQEGTVKATTMDESTLEETVKVTTMEESTLEETEKVIESTQEGTVKVNTMEESTEKVISKEESTLEEGRLEQVAQQLISLSEKVVALKKQMQIEM